jgi:hypothetical protein
MKGRRFFLLALAVAALLLVPYSAITGDRQAGHTPYEDLTNNIPDAFFDTDGDLLRDGEEPIYGTSPTDVDTDDDLCPDGVELTLWLALAQAAPVNERESKMPLADPDRDGIPNMLDPDSDNDGLLDGWEFENDLDPSKGRTYLHLLPDRWQYYPFYSGDLMDMDGDGMPDDWEVALGIENPTEDSDLDGVSNVGEYLNGTDPWGPDLLYGGTPTKDDDDNDGVVDYLEVILGLDPSRTDTDMDNIADGIEMYELRSSPFDIDTDRDFLNDGDEIVIGSSPIMKDTDGDGILDPDEATTDPTIPDTDRDLIPDKEEEGAVRDSDGDGIPDSIERASQYSNGATDPFDPDSDNDGLLDGQEDANRNGRREGNEPSDRNSDWRDGGETDPTDRDTDGGGMSDRDEIMFARDPLNPQDDRINVDPPVTPENPIDPIPINPPDPPQPRINLAGWGRVVMIALVILFVLVLTTMLYNTTTTEEDFLEDVLEALEEGERVLYSITLTDDVREAIFKSYRRFLAVMEAYGHTKGEPSTAREFATSVRGALEVDVSALHEFTHMFELARYSAHDMDLGHRDRALAAFSSVRESVSRNLGPPDRPIVEEGDEGEVSSGIWARLRRIGGRT